MTRRTDFTIDIQIVPGNTMQGAHWVSRDQLVIDFHEVEWLPKTNYERAGKLHHYVSFALARRPASTPAPLGGRTGTQAQSPAPAMLPKYSVLLGALREIRQRVALLPPAGSTDAIAAIIATIIDDVLDVVDPPKSYLVRWEVDVEARNPREAAAEARRIHNEANPQIPGDACVYDVCETGDGDTGPFIRVDLFPSGDD